MKENTSLQLSIIVPVYNVEQYIRSCIESIFQQDLNDNDFEVIIVNDGTKDHSIEVIEDFIGQHNNIILINQRNQGLSIARNNGIARAKGEYLLLLDSDDVLIKNSLIPLLRNAFVTRADLIVADFITLKNEEIIGCQHPLSPKTKSQYIEKTGKQLFLEDLDPRCCYVWRTLYRNDFLKKHQIVFIPSIRYEDIPFTHECYLKAEKCIKTSLVFYIYRKRNNSITSSFDLSKAHDFCKSIGYTWRLKKHITLTESESMKLQADLFSSVSMMNRLAYHSLLNKSEKKQMIDMLKQEAPNLSFGSGKIRHLITYLYRYMPHTLIILWHIYISFIENRVLPFYYHSTKKKY